MDKYFLYISAACLLLLSGCGNGNDGIGLHRPRSSSSVTSSLGNNLYGSDNFGACQAMIVIGGSNPSYAQATFPGSQVCRGLSRPSALLQVNASFPRNVTFCLVPMNNGVPAPESCFLINGQADIGLSTSAYTDLVLVAQSDLVLYKAYVAHQTDNAPPRAVASLSAP